MKGRIFAIVLTLLFTASAKAQNAPIPFTLSWQANTTISSTFAVHSLQSYNGQPASNPVCGHSAEGYDIWCGEIVHYAAIPKYDFNFPDNFLLEGCSNVAGTVNTTYSAPARRTITQNNTFSCVGADGAAYTVDTVTKTNQYLASCGRYACWQLFGPGNQSPITGTVTKD